MMSRPVIGLLILGVGCLDPLEGKRFACDPDGPNTCAPGHVCVPVQSPDYPGLCMPADLVMDASPALDAPDASDPGHESGGDPGRDPAPDSQAESVTDICRPDCDGRQCGSDGCGGSCGSCPPALLWCLDTRCVEGRCQDVPLENSCFIDGKCFSAGQVPGKNPCQSCQPGTSQSAWTPHPEGETCLAVGECREGQCRLPCWGDPGDDSEVRCPPGYHYDGCYCRTPPTGMNVCAIDARRMDCSEIAPGDPFWGQDGHWKRGRVRLEEVPSTGTSFPIYEDPWTGLRWVFPRSQPVTLAEAISACAAIDLSTPGVSWKLPSLGLLYGILDFSRPGCPDGSATGNKGLIPVFSPGGENPCTDSIPLWTSSPDTDVLESPRIVVKTGDGTVVSYRNDLLPDKAYPVCVQTPSFPGSVAQDTRFLRNAISPNLVFDRMTGLLWSRLPDLTARSWEQALSDCPKTFGDGWRLPDIKEFFSLVDEKRLGDCPVWYREFESDCNRVQHHCSSTPVHWQEGLMYSFDPSGRNLVSSLPQSVGGVPLCVRTIP